MSFPASAGILTPAEFSLLSTVFNGIAAEHWFTRSADRRQQFAAELLDAYRRGVTHPVELTSYAHELAALRFGDGGRLN